jgi:hypothetical protein
MRAAYLPTLKATAYTPKADYPFRAVATHEAVAEAMARIADEVAYSNFKGEVERRMGRGRASLYSEVWSVLHRLEAENPRLLAPAKRKTTRRATMRRGAAKKQRRPKRRNGAAVLRASRYRYCSH